MKARRFLLILIPALILLAAGILAFTRPDAVAWRIDRVKTYLHGVFVPVQQVPVAVGEAIPVPAITAVPQYTENSTSNQTNTVRPSAALPELPSKKNLPPPVFDPQKDYQSWNNCGPATLAIALRFWGWQGDQYKVDAVVKPSDQDKNVNMEELADYTRQQVKLDAVIRVAGDLDTIKRFISAGYPVMVETSFKLTETFWPGDDKWSSHFVLLTGYDDAAASFTAQDVYKGPNTSISYKKLNEDWQSFNFIYMVIFPPDAKTEVAALVGEDWSEPANWGKAVELANEAARNDPQNAFAWFNLGSSLAAVQQYDQSWLAFDKARQLGLPQRMLRYQFTPFLAAYETGHIQDLLNLTSFALRTTPNSEEALYWQGKAFLALQQKTQAKESFLHALSYRPGYPEAIRELNAFK
jgi:tetratricopeptide (TPR) repeat protein